MTEAKWIQQGLPLEIETPDMALSVRTSDESLSGWNRDRIVDVLVRETDLELERAQEIAREVEELIVPSNIKIITAPLIRELVDAKLIEHGFEHARKMHARLGMPLYDVGQLIHHPNRENADEFHSPEATNLTLGERIKREYALLSVFSQEVSDAHLKGDIHLHDLGAIDRPFRSGQSLEYLKRFGLSLPSSLSLARPARRPEVLLAQMVKFTGALQNHFAGAIGWDAVNLFFAPYLVGLSDREMEQLAQMMVFEFSQQAVARGRQVLTDLNLYWEVPRHFEEIPAIGPGGMETGKSYKDYADESRRFAWALFNVFEQGDGCGRPFFFPRPTVHITERFFQTPGSLDFLHRICRVAADKGNTSFVFDRGETVRIPECRRNLFKQDPSDLEEAGQPWKMRYSTIQNVTLNLPRIGYGTGKNEDRLFGKISALLNVAVKAHLEKKQFLEELLHLGHQGPLSLLTMDRDDSPYLRMDRARFLMGMVGLNELVQIHTGREMHQSGEAYQFGLKVVTRMKQILDRLSERHGMRFVLEQTQAETTAYRFAKLDLRYHSPQSGHIVKGDLSRGEIYYTHSTHLNPAAALDPFERVKQEGLFHPLIEGEAVTHVWLGESKPSETSLSRFVVNVFQQTRNDQIVFSPEFTTCNLCHRTNRGLRSVCACCGAEDVEGFARITSHFTRLSGWNKGKRGELRNRYRNEAFFKEEEDKP